jgi:prophage regulatory protein
MLGEPGVLEIIPISRSTLYRWCAAGLFPKPVAMGPQRVGWFLDEIIRWQAEIEANRDRKDAIDHR